MSKNSRRDDFSDDDTKVSSKKESSKHRKSESKGSEKENSSKRKVKKQEKKETIKEECHKVTEDPVIQMMQQIEMEELTQDIQYLNYVIEDYERVLKAVEPSKGSLNAVAIFEQQLRLMKQSIHHSQDQYEDFQDYIEELESSKEIFEEQLVGEGNSDISPVYKERALFLRETFLENERRYNSGSKEAKIVGTIMRYIEQSEIEEEWLMEVLLMIRFLAINAKNDISKISYWLSISLKLTNELRNAVQLSFNFSTNIQNVGIIDASDLQSEEWESALVESSLILLHYELYLLLCKGVFPNIDSLLEVSFFGSVALRLDSSRILSDPSRSVEGLILLLTSVLQQVKESEVYAKIIRQIFNQLFFYISTKLANRLLLSSDLCSPTVALSIKMGLSFIDGWIQETCATEDGLTGCRDQLVYIIDVVSVLMTASFQPELFESVETMRATFPSLNVLQIHTLIDSYSPDRYIPEDVSSEVRTKVLELSRDVTENDSNNGQIEFPAILLLSSLE